MVPDRSHSIFGKFCHLVGPELIAFTEERLEINIILKDNPIDDTIKKYFAENHVYAERKLLRVLGVNLR